MKNALSKAAQHDYTANAIRLQCALLADRLVAKNKSYGDSALAPVAVFAQGDAEQLIRVRLDDKLSRIKNAPDAFGEDPIDDTLGYLILLKIARARKAAKRKAAKRKAAKS